MAPCEHDAGLWREDKTLKKHRRDAVIEHWRGKKAALTSYPLRLGRWADSNQVSILQRLCKGFVVEIGCGTGRCSDAFEPDKYLGLDINPDAITIACDLNPKHLFRKIGWFDEYPKADTYLFHTSLMHVPDEDLHAVLMRTSSRVVIFEAMEPVLRKPPIYFHRSAADYIEALKRAGYRYNYIEEYNTNYQLNGPKKPKLKRRFVVAHNGE